MKCPECGSEQIVPHAKKTFIPDGYYCLKCDLVFMILGKGKRQMK